MEDPFDNYVDVLEAGRRLNIHPESERRLIRQGKIPGIKFSNKWLIREDELEHLLRPTIPGVAGRQPFCRTYAPPIGDTWTTTLSF